MLTGKAEGVPQAVFDAAMKDLDIKVVATAPTVMTPPGRPPMPAALQQEMIALGLELGVDSMGVVRGPVKAAGVQHATELSSRLDQAGYPEAGAVVRKQATDAARMVPIAPPAVLMPGVPIELQTAIARAMQLERDPLKLEALKQSLKTLPQSPERDMMINALDALILQIRTAQAIATAAVEIDQATRPAVVPITSLPVKRTLKLAMPNMKGDDVKLWQAALLAAGFVVGVDGIFGPKVDAATRAFQKSRGVKVDGIVGPATIAAIGRPPTAAVVIPGPTTIRLLKLTTPNMKGADVMTWQAVLNTSGSMPVGTDGIFGPKVDAATRDWQRKRGINPDGIVGPTTRAAIGKPPITGKVVPAPAVITPIAKSPREVTAQALSTHLLALQQKHGVKASKGKQDMALVKRFQKDVGGVADGLPGVNTTVALARAGQGRLPKVMYWPKTGTKAKDLPAYRTQLANLAATAKSAGLTALATAITQSALAEDGSGMLA